MSSSQLGERLPLRVLWFEGADAIDGAVPDSIGDDPETFSALLSRVA